MPGKSGSEFLADDTRHSVGSIVSNDGEFCLLFQAGVFAGCE